MRVLKKLKGTVLMLRLTLQFHPGWWIYKNVNNNCNTLYFTLAACWRVELVWWRMLEMAELGVTGHYSGEVEENLDAQWLE